MKTLVIKGYCSVGIFIHLWTILPALSLPSLLASSQHHCRLAAEDKMVAGGGGQAGRGGGGWGAGAERGTMGA